MEIKREGYTVRVGEPRIHVDNRRRGRSGHMTHAMAEFAKGRIIDFHSNCSAVRNGGHFPYGWVEYRISEDGGRTFSEDKTLAYSYQSFLDGIYTISVEKAVASEDGAVVAFCLRNDAMSQTFCEPWATPTVIRSQDGGATFSEAEEYAPYPGRTYDATTFKGVIYALHFCNPNFLGTEEGHKYRIYQSADGGRSFSELCAVPIDGMGRGYGSMLFDTDGTLHVYAYNSNDEEHMDHAVSRDLGKTWTVLPPSYLEKGIRNPQTALLDGVFVLHGRSGDRHGFVLYTSQNGRDWDGGVYLEQKAYLAGAYYSNNLVLEEEGKQSLLIQYSSPYTEEPSPYYVGTVNVKHVWLSIERK